MASVDTKTMPQVSLGSFETDSLDWQTSETGLGYRCEVRLVQEDDEFVAYVANLPGVHSQGETKREAQLNIEDALQATLAAYKDSKQDTPWAEPRAKKENEESIWVFIDA